jgi:hypothetical protein
VKNIWLNALIDKKFIIRFFTSIIVLIFTMLVFGRFVHFIEGRAGVQLTDELLNSFNAINLSWPIFILIYGAIAWAIFIMLFFPEKLIILFCSYILMVLVRMAMMYCMPLIPPIGTIILKDPFIEIFGNSIPLSKDLFFSGHTATLSLLYLVVPQKWKMIFLSITICVAICVLLQKVHYTIDVLVAPFISFSCYKMASRFHEKLIQL